MGIAVDPPSPPLSNGYVEKKVLQTILASLHTPRLSGKISKMGSRNTSLSIAHVPPGRGGIDLCCRGEWIEEQLEVERPTGNNWATSAESELFILPINKMVVVTRKNGFP